MAIEPFKQMSGISFVLHRSIPLRIACISRLTGERRALKVVTDDRINGACLFDVHGSFGPRSLHFCGFKLVNYWLKTYVFGCHVVCQRLPSMLGNTSIQ